MKHLRQIQFYTMIIIYCILTSKGKIGRFTSQVFISTLSFYCNVDLHSLRSYQFTIFCTQPLANHRVCKQQLNKNVATIQSTFKRWNTRRLHRRTALNSETLMERPQDKLLVAIENTIQIRKNDWQTRIYTYQYDSKNTEDELLIASQSIMLMDRNNYFRATP